MQLIYILILAVFQGLTEFLPISSSGHLAILQHYLGMKEGGLLLSLVLHTGTLLAVVIYFAKDILALFRSLKYHKNPTLYYLILGSIPTAVIGLLIKKHYEALSSLWIIGIMLFITGALLLIIKNAQENQGKNSFKKSLIIGTVQGLAVLPGISRSGSTIATAMLLKINKQTAFTFSFLLSLPAIVGADLLELIKLHQNPEAVPYSLWHLAAGFALSFLVGLGALVFLRKLI
ncbi:MAG: hypothetical protein CVV50_04085, partial [Spirochaetae bacterium HGW-Spirochaetae-6]